MTTGRKSSLGHVIPAGGGIQDGETVLDILAASPATAHHIALEMCERFVSDKPSPALVDHIAGVFTQTGGDLRKVTEAILTSPEFLSASDDNTKVKSPLEFAVSAVRANRLEPEPRRRRLHGPCAQLHGRRRHARPPGRGGSPQQAPRQSLNWHIYDLGEPLFACAPPTGYTENSAEWVSPGALIERLNFAIALTEQKVSDVNFDPQGLFAGVDLDNRRPSSIAPSELSCKITSATPRKKSSSKPRYPSPVRTKSSTPTSSSPSSSARPNFRRNEWPPKNAEITKNVEALVSHPFVFFAIFCGQ